MLKQLRNKKTAKKIWIILAIVVLPPFVLWGTGSLMGNKTKNEPLYAGKIYGRKVPLAEYKNALEAVRAQMIMQLGENFSQLEKLLNLEEQAWERIILLSEIKKQKIKITDKEVIELIRSYPFFQRSGKFDEQIYKQTLRYVLNIQPRAYEERIRQNLGLSKLYDQITTNPQVTEEELRKQYEKDNEQISVDYITAIPADFTKDITVDEKELKDYFEAHQLDFKQPLSFNLEYIPSESEEKINSLLPLFGKIDEFDKAVTDAGLSKKETGAFAETAPIPGIGWSTEVSNLVSKAKPRELLPVIKLDKKYYLIWIKDRIEPAIPDFEEIKDNIKEIVAKNKTDALAKGKIEECLKNLKAAGQEDFTAQAKALGLKNNSTELFKFGSYIEGIGSSDLFWETARNLKDKAFSEVISLTNGYYIIKLKSRQPIDEAKFKEEKENLTKKLSNEKKEEKFRGFLEKLKKKAQRF